MADNVKILEPTGSAPTGYEQTLSGAKQIGGASGAKFQRIVPTFEATGGVQTDVGDAAPMPVAMADGKLATLGALADAPPANAGAIGGARSVISLLKAIAAWAMTPVLAAGEAHVGQVGGDSAIATANFTRPADTTAYASGDLVANSVSSGSAAPMELTVARKNGGTGRIARLRLTKSSLSIANAAFRVHLFRSAPVIQAGSGDNLAMLSNNALGYLGGFDVTTDRGFSDGVKGFAGVISGPYLTFECASDSTKLYALIEARGAYAPASAETFTLALEVDRD
jgi:hypothetical protein